MNDKAEQSVKWINLALDLLIKTQGYGEKLYIAYSGGKDSECLAHLCIEHIPHDRLEIVYNVTGIDPPEVVKHIKANFRRWRAMGIECTWDKPTTTMHDLIVKKGPPTRTMRFCCEHFKETKSDFRITLTGVRWAESPRRKAKHDVLTVVGKSKTGGEKYHMDNDIRSRFAEPCPYKGRYVFNPIIEWEDSDVWDYIRGNEIDYCKLYDEGFKRLGCIGCPMAGRRGMTREFRRWPYMARYYRKAFQAFLDRRAVDLAEKYNWRTVDDIWHWWLEDGVLPGQTAMDLEYGSDFDA